MILHLPNPDVHWNILAEDGSHIKTYPALCGREGSTGVLQPGDERKSNCKYCLEIRKARIMARLSLRVPC